MILKGLYAITEWMEDEKYKNFDEWGKRHGITGLRPLRDYSDGYERDYADYDYPGPGLEAAFWDIPNM